MAEIIGYIDQVVIELLGISILPNTPIMLGQSNIEHMKQSHPDDFEKYFSKIKEIISDPDYVNINPRDNSIKYIKRFSDCVIIGVRISGKGKAFARTIYIFPPWKFQQYMDGGYLKPYK